MEEKIKKIVENILKNFRGTLGIGFKDLREDKEFYFNGDKRFLTASVFKVFVLIELYNQKVSEREDLDERHTLTEENKILPSGILQDMQEGLRPTVRDLAKLMMMISDNTATDIIINILGKENINKTIHNILELKDTRVYLTTREMLLDMAGAQNVEDAKENFEEIKINKNGKWTTDFEYNNVTTPKEMVKTLGFLYKKEILTPEACKEIIDIMKSCQTAEARIKRFLPGNVKVAQKTGTMYGVVNNAGIIFTSKRDYILVVFINGLDYESQPYMAVGENIIADISKNVYNAILKLN